MANIRPEAIGAANDYNDADGNTVLTCWQLEVRKEHPKISCSSVRVDLGSRSVCDFGIQPIRLSRES
jgi:hypothetical protein